MLFKNWFSGPTNSGRKLGRLREDGVLLGTRKKKGRLFHFYVHQNSFFEILFHNDDIQQDAEHLMQFSKLEEFNFHVEREFNSHF